VANTNFVKRVVFPLEVLPWIAMTSALFHAATNLAVLLLAQLLLNQHMPWTVLLFPFVLLPLILGTIGLMWILASVGVFARDVNQVTGMFVTLMLFLSPVFYPVAAAPEALRFWLYLNPMTFILEQSRNVLVLGVVPHWSGWLAYTGVGSLMAWGGYACFQRTRGGFADVL
jgi:lipopolysaccharide transport system permease protein